MRKLVAHALESGLADHLGDPVLLRLVGRDALRVQRGPLRHQRQDLVRQHVELLAGEGGQRDDRGPVLAQRIDLQQTLRDLVTAGRIHLGHDRDLLRARIPVEGRGDPPVPRPDLLVRRNAEADDIDVAQHLLHEVVQALTEQRARLVDSRGVHDDELPLRAVDDAADSATRRLRLLARDRDLLADEGVRERRFPDVGAADEGHETASGVVSHRLDLLHPAKRRVPPPHVPRTPSRYLVHAPAMHRR